jgi:hypothetical protein
MSREQCNILAGRERRRIVAQLTSIVRELSLGAARASPVGLGDWFAVRFSTDDEYVVASERD